MSNYNAGTLSPSTAPYSVNNYSVSSSWYDSTDVFQFSLNSTSDINVALDPINADADLQLYFDSNYNGYFDSSDTVIASSTWGGTTDDTLNLADQGSGTYFAQVYYYYSSSGSVNYNLDISATSNYSPSNLIPKEYNVGSLDYDQTYYGYVGSSDPYEGYHSDTTDTYYFELGLYEGVNITLSGLSSDADIRLIQDYDSDGVVDDYEVQDYSTNGGITSDSISTDWSGNYFLQVYQFSGDTNYTLTFDHYPTTYA
jgi:hypothetical protein